MRGVDRKPHRRSCFYEKGLEVLRAGAGAVCGRQWDWAVRESSGGCGHGHSGGVAWRPVWRVGDTALRTSPLVIPRDLRIFYLNVEDDLGRWISPEFQKMSMVSSEEVWRRNVFLVRRKRI